VKFSRPRGYRPYPIQAAKKFYLVLKKGEGMKDQGKIGIFRENFPNPEVVDPSNNFFFTQIPITRKPSDNLPNQKKSHYCRVY